ncbi:hypothetical protein TNIN_206351 [Trichonephila inaurata madagascariensis]|uniref:Uncharacterized protein n=1 Tax=Trichonephila inaurata madagascariensis TaxID=2747483 RepID=A0A8X7C009_9ARAC|nr:hypothetical protein TNIN_206351 [Trichonephila inaurata madagascariensis]
MNQRGEQLWEKKDLKKVRKKRGQQDKYQETFEKTEKKKNVRSSKRRNSLDTSGDSFDEDNNDDFCAVYKGYFYTKKRSQVCWIQCIENNTSSI